MHVHALLMAKALAAYAFAGLNCACQEKNDFLLGANRDFQMIVDAYNKFRDSRFTDPQRPLLLE